MTKKMSLKVTLFPRVLSLSKAGYIPDYVNAIDQSGNMEVVNPPHKNPLLNILSPKYWGDVFIFNWPENIPDARFGKIQTLLFFRCPCCGGHWDVRGGVPHYCPECGEYIW